MNGANVYCSQMSIAVAFTQSSLFVKVSSISPFIDTRKALALVLNPDLPEDAFSKIE